MLNLPMREMGAFEIEYGSVSVIDFRNPGTKARLISHAPWREL